MVRFDVEVEPTQNRFRTYNIKNMDLIGIPDNTGQLTSHEIRDTRSNISRMDEVVSQSDPTSSICNNPENNNSITPDDTDFINDPIQSDVWPAAISKQQEII